MLRLALAQINTTVGDLSGNCRKIADGISAAKSAGADIVLFPELAVTGYPPEDLLYKEHFVQDNTKALNALAKEIVGIVAVVGFVDKDPEKNLYNAAAVIANGKVRGIYRKHALPNYGVFDEKRYFREGNSNHLFSFNGTKIGVNICEDIWLKDGIHRAQAKAGAQVFLNISSSPYDFRKFQQREKLLIGRAKETKAFICYVNLVGGQDELVFDGGSLVVDPKGKILAAGKQFAEDLVLVDLPVEAFKKKSGRGKVISLPSHANNTEKEPLPQRPLENLIQEEATFRALVLGTRDYVKKNGFEKVVIGLSGGIDSSLVAVIAKEAVGKENVIGVSMPSVFTSPETRADGEKIAENLDIRFMEIPIQEIFATYLEVLKKEFAGYAPNVAEENIQARIRGNILMALSNKFGWLVLTTGNKSEIAVGYCTLYGDMSGGFAVIKDVPKTLVYEISAFVNRIKNQVIPKSVLERAPTAELRENQKDEDNLPPYKILDPLLKAYVEEHKSLFHAAHGDNDLARKVMGMVDRSEYKRRQAPPGVKITPRAFGKDWRLPITNKYKES